MKLKFTTQDQDAILTECESLGGKAAEAAEVAISLDQQLLEMSFKIKEFESKIEELTK
jgi:hypothetical protein